MADWSIMDREWQSDGSYDFDPFYGMNIYYQEKPPLPDLYPQPHAQQFESQPTSPALRMLLASPQQVPSMPPPLPPPPSLPPPQPPIPVYTVPEYTVPRGDNPREIRNKAEKQRRDKLNHSISELAAMVPPVVAANKKIDKTGVLRLTAHYLRAHQYVFGDSIWKSPREFNPATAQALLNLLDGFLLTTTYKGLVVVVSQNVQLYLGYAELDLLGHSVFNIVHPDDHQKLKENLMPRSHLLGPSGELLIPDEPDGNKKVADELASEKRRFVVRFKKQCSRSEPAQYVSCFVEGTLRKADRARRGYNRTCQVIRRARARADNPCSSGNDVVFIGVVRPSKETFMTEKHIDSFRMEYRTRHSIDGEIMECEQRISLVTGYMTHEVNGANAMNFMHKDDVRWVIFALREMYQQQTLVGESCYRLMTKNGQFIYLRTVGRLDVEHGSRAVRSFVCLNTVVEEPDGKHLIKMMKKKYKLNMNNNDMAQQEDDESSNVIEDSGLPVEDPRNLEKDILNLVTDLPAIRNGSQSDDSGCGTEQQQSPSLSLAIIPPRKERILSSIEKIYTLIKSFKQRPALASHKMEKKMNVTKCDPGEEKINTPQALSPRSTSPSRHALSGRANAKLRRKLEGRGASAAELDPRSVSPFGALYSPTIAARDDFVTVSLPETPIRRTLQVPQNTLPIPAYFQTIIQSQFNTEDLLLDETPYVAQPTIYEVDMETVQETGFPVGAGVKRPNEPTDSLEETVSKRINNQPHPQEHHVIEIGEGNDEEGPDFGRILVSESILSTAMNSLENVIDPNFPDLLGQEVEEILEEIEKPSSPIDPQRVFPLEKLV